MRHPEVFDVLNSQSITTSQSPLSPLSSRSSPTHAAAPALRLQVRWARHLDEIRQAQRLRYQVFAEEMGAVLQVVASLRNHGVSVLLVEQNARAALKVADRAFVLEMGAVALSGKASDLLGDKRIIETYLGMGNKAAVETV